MVNNGYPRGTGQSPSPFIFSSVPTNGNRAQPAVDSQNNVHWQHEVQRVQKENKVLRQTVATLETKVHELTSRLEATEQQIKTRDLIWAEELKKAVQEARNEARLGSAFVRSTTQARVSKSSALWENQSDTESEADEDECTRTAYCRPSTGSSRNHRVAKIPKSPAIVKQEPPPSQPKQNAHKLIEPSPSPSRTLPKELIVAFNQLPKEPVATVKVPKCLNGTTRHYWATKCSNGSVRRYTCKMCSCLVREGKGFNKDGVQIWIPRV